MENIEEFKSYTGVYFRGSLPEQGTEYWSEEQWKQHEEFVKECEKDGTLGERQEVTITLKHSPLLDSTSHMLYPLENYQMYFIDND